MKEDNDLTTVKNYKALKDTFSREERKLLRCSIRKSLLKIELNTINFLEGINQK